MKIIKTITLLILTFILFTSSAPAQSGWWHANAHVNLTRVRVDAYVYNGFPRPVYCEGRVNGYTLSGHVLWSNYAAVIPPGRNVHAYVYTNLNNPFVNGNANIQCRWY